MARFARNRLYRQNAFAGVANVDTDDELEPAPVGVPSWGIDGETFVTQQNPGFVRSGTRYTFTSAGYLQRVRFHVPTINPAILYLGTVERIAPGGDIPLFEQVMPDGVSGWVEFPFAGVARIGQIYEVALYAIDLTGTPGLQNSWRYGGADQNVDPVAQEFNHNNQHTVLRIHTTAEDNSDQTAPLLAINTGDSVVLTDATSTWRYVVNAPGQLAAGVVTFPDVTRYEVDGSFALQASILVQSFAPSLTALDYSEDLGFWGAAPFASAVGKLQLDPSLPPVESNAAYGGDLEVQRLILSPDWDIVSISEQLGL